MKLVAIYPYFDSFNLNTNTVSNNVGFWPTYKERFTMVTACVMSQIFIMIERNNGRENNPTIQICATLKWKYHSH